MLSWCDVQLGCSSRELGLWERGQRWGSGSRMWRTALSQLLQRVVVASPPPPTHAGQLRGLAAPAWGFGSRFSAGFHDTRWVCEEAGSLRVERLSGSLRDGRRNSKDSRTAEAKFVEKICRVIKRGEWGTGTEDRLEKLKIRLRSKVVNKVIRGLDDADIAHCFFQWARKQPSFHHSLQAYHVIIEIMGAAQKFDMQSQLLQDMHCQGLQANTSTYNILLLGFSRANYTDKVVESLNQMVQCGLSPNAFTFKCVIRSLVWSGRALEALSIYTKMVEFGYVPDNFTYNGLIEGLCKAGYVDEAFTIFQEMEDRGLCPDAIAHAALIKGLDTKGRVDEACRMFQEMAGKNLRSVVNTHKGVLGVFSKRHKEDLSSKSAIAVV